MKNIYLSVTSFLGGTAVALGALGAHFLKEKMKTGLISADQLNGFDTATKYQLFHALALLIVFVMNKEQNHKWLNRAANMFIAGIILFSGSIYLLSTRNLTGIGGISFLGPLTPIGGIAFLTGWAFIFVYSIQKNNKV